jgi:SAM-dependent methyltransferase
MRNPLRTNLKQKSLYDYPKYYDLLFGSDWRSEFHFLRRCFANHARRRVRRVFEPACGTGRLLVKLADAGYRVLGNDLNRRTVDFCNQRLVRRGHKPSATVGDMSDFRLPQPVDAAFNLINSFRHLASEDAARGHLRCVAGALAPGGLYVLGLHLTPRGRPTCDFERWAARRGNLAATIEMRSLEVDRRRRQEHVRMTLDVYRPTGSMRLVEQLAFRTYTAAQFARLLADETALETVETYDFGYRRPVIVDRASEDIVFVLRKRA